MLPRFQHILIPVDFSTKTRAALDVAVEMAAVNHSRVTLLHVVEPIEVGGSVDTELDEFYKQLGANAVAELDYLSQRFDGLPCDVQCRTEFGKRVSTIVKFIERRNVDLVILSSHRLDTSQPVRSLASVSYQVGILAPCAVLMVKTEQTGQSAAAGESS